MRLTGTGRALVALALVWTRGRRFARPAPDRWEVRREAERLGRGRDQPRACLRVAARKQCNLVPLRNKFFSQVRDDALRAPVKCGRHGKVKRSNLRDSHVCYRSVSDKRR